MPAGVPWTLADGMTIRWPTREIGNANTESQLKAWLFFYIWEQVSPISC